MAGGSKGRRTYARDNRGRFASTGTTRSRPAPKQAATKGTNRLTRNNSGRIVGVGKNGATARGGRLRTGAGNQRATQTARLKRAPMAGVVSRSGKARAVPAPRVPSRIANRSAADQAHRDKLAKQWKTVEKPARRAVATARASVGVAATVPSYPRLTRASKIRGDARFVRENVYNQVGRLRSGPTRGKNKLTPQQRAQIVADAVGSARSLRARAAMTTPRRSTLKARAARPGGTIAKPKGLKPGAIKPKATPKPKAPRSPATSRLRPGELMNAVARPVGTMARPRKGRNPYQAGIANMEYQVSATNDDKKARLANAQATKAMFEGQGLSVKYNSGRGSSTVASYNPATKQMTINRSHTSWVNPAAAAIKERRRGAKSSSAPMHTFFHEMGHARDKNLLSRSTPFGQFWVLATQKGPSQEARAARGNQMARLARRVSRYATTNPSEFIAETYAGLKTGRRYDFQVMRAYREAMGLSPNPAPRRRSRLRRPKP